ncbi:LacI family transcriptional regulator [Cupriavidus basilensis OR16]|uniref:LacI family transcriptional regulator n=1 Tax=Cupriavidus basilensis OR16 TaxID=1127483 RepID=H1SCT7_9BURK|nr:LacI family DNA-binding transcriptional regulator [Cupriavidus basilensis]EHP39678.1 LacI family transcriptional regulator [Cupriavidus basilensis OR16]
MKPRITIREVAKEAGVSIGTASRALNRAGRVSDAAIAAVTKAASRLGYEPDAIAQSMRTRSSGAIGILVSDLSNPLYARIIISIEASLQAAGYALLIASTHNDGKREKSLIDLFRRRRVDGLILAPCETENPKLLEQLSQEMPVIALDRDLSPVGTGVQVDHYGGAMQATRYLLNLGHTRIALLTPGSTLRPGRERIAGFTDAYKERGLMPVPKLIRSEKSSMDFAFSEALSLLSGPQAPTAFLCLGTRILSGVLQALRHTGRAVPGDVSVISIGDTDLSQLFSPSITSLTWDLDVVGTVLSQILLKRLEKDAEVEPETIGITTQLVLRESCGPAVAGRKTTTA